MPVKCRWPWTSISIVNDIIPGNLLVTNCSLPVTARNYLHYAGAGAAKGKIGGCMVFFRKPSRLSTRNTYPLPFPRSVITPLLWKVCLYKICKTEWTYTSNYRHSRILKLFFTRHPISRQFPIDLSLKTPQKRFNFLDLIQILVLGGLS